MYITGFDFYWMDGTEKDYTHWDILQPSDLDENEDCVEVYADNGKWNDIFCNRVNAYVCKFYKGRNSR